MIAAIAIAWPALLAPLPIRQDEARAAAERVLERMAPGKRSALHGAIFRWHEKQDAARPTPDRSVLAALRHPDALRLEVKSPGSGGFVLRRSAGRAWLTADGASVEIEPVAEHDSHRLFLLLGSLLGWDLLDVRQTPKLVGNELTSTAAWLDARAPVVIRRRLDADGGVSELRLGETVFRLEGAARANGRLAATVVGPERSLVLELVETDVAFQADYFAPPAAKPASQADMVSGGERRNFKTPRLERRPPAWVIELDDPGSWATRFDLLDRIGRELHDRGHEPVGLPVVTEAGRLQVCYTPARGDAKPEVPGRPKPVRRPDAMVAVLYVEAPWDQARETLAAKLRQHAQALGLRPEGRVDFIPYLIPGESTVPAADTAILVRGELAVR